MILQLNPTIPLVTPRGKGFALFLINPSDEHNIQWVVAQDTGEIWTWQNPEIRMQSNVTLGRDVDTKAIKSNAAPSSGHCHLCALPSKYAGKVCQKKNCPINPLASA